MIYEVIGWYTIEEDAEGELHEVWHEGEPPNPNDPESMVVLMTDEVTGEQDTVRVHMPAGLDYEDWEGWNWGDWDDAILDAGDMSGIQ